MGTIFDILGPTTASGVHVASFKYGDPITPMQFDMHGHASSICVPAPSFDTGLGVYSCDEGCHFWLSQPESGTEIGPLPSDIISQHGGVFLPHGASIKGDYYDPSSFVHYPVSPGRWQVVVPNQKCYGCLLVTVCNNEAVITAGLGKRDRKLMHSAGLYAVSHIGAPVEGLYASDDLVQSVIEEVEETPLAQPQTRSRQT